MHQKENAKKYVNEKHNFFFICNTLKIGGQGKEKSAYLFSFIYIFLIT